MPRATTSYAHAIAHLTAVDPAMAQVIKAVGPCQLRRRSGLAHFDSLVRAIIYQQLSGKAAQTILERMLQIWGDRYPRPEELLQVDAARLSAAGVSRQKAGYLVDLAERVHRGEVPLDRLTRLSDAHVEESLTRVKGVGRWSAQMFLMFHLGRSDVLPEGDLGIRKGVQKAYGLRKLPDPDRVIRIGRPWSPHSSVASWYLWRVLELPDGAFQRHIPRR